MKTVTADAKQRIRLPDIKPQTTFAYSDNGNGTITLTVVTAEPKPAFPRGSLKPYLDKKWEDEQLARVRACVKCPDHLE